MEARVAEAAQRAGGRLELLWGSTLYHKDDLPFAEGLRDMPDMFTPFKDKVRGWVRRRVGVWVWVWGGWMGLGGLLAAPVPRGWLCRWVAPALPPDARLAGCSAVGRGSGCSLWVCRVLGTTAPCSNEESGRRHRLPCLPPRSTHPHARRSTRAVREPQLRAAVPSGAGARGASAARGAGRCPAGIPALTGGGPECPAATGHGAAGGGRQRQPREPPGWGRGAASAGRGWWGCAGWGWAAQVQVPCVGVGGGGAGGRWSQQHRVGDAVQLQ